MSSFSCVLVLGKLVLNCSAVSPGADCVLSFSILEVIGIFKLSIGLDKESNF